MGPTRAGEAHAGRSSCSRIRREPFAPWPCRHPGHGAKEGGTTSAVLTGRRTSQTGRFDWRNPSRASHQGRIAPASSFACTCSSVLMRGVFLPGCAGATLQAFANRVMDRKQALHLLSRRLHGLRLAAYAASETSLARGERHAEAGEHGSRSAVFAPRCAAGSLRGASLSSAGRNTRARGNSAGDQCGGGRRGCLANDVRKLRLEARHLRELALMYENRPLEMPAKAIDEIRLAADHLDAAAAITEEHESV